MFVPNSPLRYNYVYTNDDDVSFNIVKIDTSETLELMKVPLITLGTAGHIVVDFNSPFKVKRLFEYTFDGDITIINDDLVNTQFSFDGVHTKTPLNIDISVIGLYLVISIDVSGSTIELLGRCNITPK